MEALVRISERLTAIEAKQQLSEQSLGNFARVQDVGGSAVARTLSELSDQISKLEHTLSSSVTILDQLKSGVASIEAMKERTAQLDRNLVDTSAAITQSVTTMQAANAQAAEYIDKRIYEMDGRLGDALATLQKSLAHVAEHLDKKIYDASGGLTAAIKVVQSSQGDTGAHLDRQIQGMTTRFSEATQAFDLGLNRLLGRVSSVATSLDARSAAGGDSNAARYLDLLEAELTGVLHADVSAAPWTHDTYDPARREVGLDWPKTATTMIGTARMRNLRHLCERVIAEGTAGDFIETGVWRGGACIYMRAILEAHGDPGRRVIVADSFAGLPPPSPNEFPADAGDTHYQVDQLAVTRREVEGNFRRYGLLDERVVFLEGWFKDTLPRAPVDRISVLRLDGDMYESTQQALDALYAKVTPGGFVIVDDYVLKPCALAVDEFRARHGIADPLVEVDGAAVWWQVSGK